MAVVESKLKDGEIKLGTTPAELDFSCQVINARITTAYTDDGEAQEVLCGDMLAAGQKLDGRTLSGTFIQDWTAAAASSVTKFCFTHELEKMAFSYTPNVEADTITGELTVTVPAETWGGDVNTRLTSEFEWRISGDLTFTPPVVTLEAMTVDELKATASAQGLATSGTKQELVDRLSGAELVPA